MREYIVHGTLAVAFILSLLAYVLLQLEGPGQPGPLDEMLLVLGGAIAGAAVPRASNA